MQNGSKVLWMGGKEMTNWKKFLTEKILRECWHNVNKSGDIYCCKKCGKARLSILLGKLRYSDNHAFDNQNDLMELYRAIYMDGKWTEFTDSVFKYYKDDPTAEIFDAWLFCLGGEYYEDRCKMVAEFYG
jgi:hypothetical protein